MGSLLAATALLLLSAPPVADAPATATATMRADAGDEDYRARRFIVAARAYAEALPTSSADPELWYKLGATRAAMRDGLSALDAWQTALSFAPERELIYRHASLLSMAMARRGQLELRPTPLAETPRLAQARRALADASPARALDLLRGAEGAIATWLRAEAMLALGLLNEARAQFEAALTADPTLREATGGLAETLLRQGDTATASPLLRQWMGDRALSPEAFIVERARELAEQLRAP